MQQRLSSTKLRLRSAATLALALTATLTLTLATPATATTHTPPVPPQALRAYMAQVEKVRLPVNTLLNGADPIIDSLADHTTTPAQASAAMNTLEERFAGYLLAMQEITPTNPTLRRINKPYAHTYFLEDNYLSTLASDLNEGDYDNLPNTQDQQRLAIIVWRTQMEMLAKQNGVTLPPDLQQAGHGEIAPAPSGS